MQKTSNYQLNQWEPTDKLSREDFNSDNAAIDAALKAVADTANGKASAESVTALQQSVNSQIAALSTALGSGGSNCRIEWGSYTGTGKSGFSLTFDFKPVVVFVGGANHVNTNAWPSIYVQGFTSAHSDLDATKTQTVTWTENGLSWYTSGDLSGMPGYYNNNLSGITYYYCAFGA